MGTKLNRLVYYTSTAFFALSALLFVGVFISSLEKNAIDMCLRVGLFNWRVAGNYLGLFIGFVAYIIFAIILKILRLEHNLEWFRKFTHELTHTLVALCLFKTINEFVVRGRECYVSFKSGKVGLGYLPITLSPYCIPIFTFMLFPFRFAGDASYMIVFDVLIAFTYAFHIHSFIKQTRLTQSDIKNCGIAQSIAFLAFSHLAVLSLILAIPKGGVLNAISRVFWEYPWDIITDSVEWILEIFNIF